MKHKVKEISNNRVVVEDSKSNTVLLMEKDDDNNITITYSELLISSYIDELGKLMINNMIE